nr:hypothetical protein [Mycobacterium tuberculosis]
MSAVAGAAAPVYLAYSDPVAAPAATGGVGGVGGVGGGWVTSPAPASVALGVWVGPVVLVGCCSVTGGDGGRNESGTGVSGVGGVGGAGGAGGLLFGNGRRRRA